VGRLVHHGTGNTQCRHIRPFIYIFSCSWNVWLFFGQYTSCSLL